MRPSKVRILIADDFAPWRQLIRNLLQKRPDWLVVHEASNGIQAVEKAVELCPDVVVLDIGMPGLSGLAVATLLRTKRPGSILVFVTQVHDPEIKAAALQLAGAAYLLKTEAATGLVNAIVNALQSRSKDGNLVRVQGTQS